MFKKLFCVVLAFVITMGSLTFAGETAENTEVKEKTYENELVTDETVEIEKVFDITLLSYVADDIAMSIPAYERDEDELVTTPETKGLEGETWNNRNRYKYKMNGESNPYSKMYVAIGAALEPSTDEYMLVDIRLNILNSAIAPLELTEATEALLTYDGDYEFPLTTIMTEKTDPLDNKNEWLSDDTEIPVLVNRNVHLIFEVPEVVATDTKSLEATITISGREFKVVLK